MNKCKTFRNLTRKRCSILAAQNGLRYWNIWNSLRYQASEILCRTPDGAPHMRGRAVVKTQALGRLLEVTPDDVNERFPTHHRVGVEGVNIVDGNHARSHVPLVIPGTLVSVLDIVVGLVVRPEMLDVHFRIRVTDRLVGEETQRLVRAHRPGYLLVDIGLDQLRAPVAVIALDEDGIGDVVQQTGENRLLGHGCF